MRPIIEEMDLVGAWLRQLLRAGTVAALVPVAIVASLAVVVAGAGGIGGLGSLGQVVTGPDISPALRVEPEATRGDRELALVAPPELVASAEPLSAPQAPGAASGASTDVAPRPPPSGRVVTGRRPARPAPPPPITPLPPPAPPAAAPAPARPPTARERTGKVVEELGETVTEVVGGAIGGLGETVGGLLGGPPPDR